MRIILRENAGPAIRPKQRQQLHPPLAQHWRQMGDIPVAQQVLYVFEVGSYPEPLIRFRSGTAAILAEKAESAQQRIDVLAVIARALPAAAIGGTRDNEYNDEERFHDRSI